MVPDARARSSTGAEVAHAGTAQVNPAAAPRCPSPVEPLHLVGAAQELAPLLGQLLQGPPALVQLLQEDSGQRGCTPASLQHAAQNQTTGARLARSGRSTDDFLSLPFPAQ